WSPLCFSFLLLYLSLLYHALHSFPTRRSSDLLHTKIIEYNNPEAFFFTGFTQDKYHNNFTEYFWRNPIIPAQMCIHASIFKTFRSEEHTSELQSRENLVCRLLLEKKNKNINRC